MKKLLLGLLAVLSFFCFSSFLPISNGTPYSKAQIESFVREVFAAQADALVLNSSSDRLRLIENFLGRFQILHKPEYAGKKFPLLSSVALVNKYNPNLSRDAAVNPNTFNPLKYNLPMASKAKEIIRVDHTDYVIVIEPVN